VTHWWGLPLSRLGRRPNASASPLGLVGGSDDRRKGKLLSPSGASQASRPRGGSRSRRRDPAHRWHATPSLRPPRSWHRSGENEAVHALEPPEARVGRRPSASASPLGPGRRIRRPPECRQVRQGRLAGSAIRDSSRRYTRWSKPACAIRHSAQGFRTRVAGPSTFSCDIAYS
jgi:hypothetical protein